MIERKLGEVVDIGEEQFGVMPGRSTNHAIFPQRQLIERYGNRQQNLDCVFNNLKKVFDGMSRHKVWNCMRLEGVPEPYFQLV